MDADRGDRELIRRIQSDASALEALYRRHVQRLTRYAAVRCRTPEDVADLVAATFVAAVESADRYDAARGDVFPWLVGIARHLSSDAARYALRERQALAKVAGWRSLGRDEIADLEARIDAAHEASEIEQALRRLHPRDREPLQLLGHVGLTNPEAAQALGISNAAFRIRLMRARRALRKAQASDQGRQSDPATVEEATT